MTGSATSEDVDVELSYLRRLELYERERPFQIFINIPLDAPDQRFTNLEFEKKTSTIHDVRNEVSSYSLDQHGFEIKPFHTAMDLESFSNRHAVEKVYLPEIESLLREEMHGVDRVFFFDWRLRCPEGQLGTNDVRLDLNDLTTWLRPAAHVHVDQSPAAVVHRVQLQLKDEAEKLLRGRVRIVNAWRPLANEVEDYPLAFCDGTTICKEDLVECDHVRMKFIGATLYAQHSEGHKWHYLSRQKPNEILLMKMFDSKEDSPAKCCPHTSFKHPSTRKNAPPRRSIEVRALVFTYPDSQPGFAGQTGLAN